jgi:hypothetical protein
MEKINTVTRPQLHALPDWRFIFWIHALKREEKQPPCELVISRSQKGSSKCTYSKIYTYRVYYSSFLCVLSKAVYEMKFLWKKASPFSPKSCQNGENCTADNLYVYTNDRSYCNGKVRIYSGSSWLKLSYHIWVYMFSTESRNQLVTEFLNPETKWRYSGNTLYTVFAPMRECVGLS